MIEEKLIKHNFSSRKGKKVEYIVVHDTGNKRAGADAEAHYRYFNSPRNASAHYFVDDKKILRIIKDEDAAWHCGDGRGKYGIYNSNSIGVEICVNSDGHYPTAVKKTQELVKELMKKHNVPLNKVVRHYDASRKPCPRSMSGNDWAAWDQFKKELETDPNTVWVKYRGRMIGVPGMMENDKNYVAIRELLEGMGYKVGWDNVKKVVLIDEV